MTDCRRHRQPYMFTLLVPLFFPLFLYYLIPFPLPTLACQKRVWLDLQPLFPPPHPPHVFQNTNNVIRLHGNPAFTRKHNPICTCACLASRIDILFKLLFTACLSRLPRGLSSRCLLLSFMCIILFFNGKTMVAQSPAPLQKYIASRERRTSRQLQQQDNSP